MAVNDQPVPAAEAYCTDQPPMLSVLLPLLNSSMKSLRMSEPALPPAPKTWLMTTAAWDGPAATSQARGKARRRARQWRPRPRR